MSTKFFVNILTEKPPYDQTRQVDRSTNCLHTALDYNREDDYLPKNATDITRQVAHNLFLSLPKILIQKTPTQNSVNETEAVNEQCFEKTTCYGITEEHYLWKIKNRKD